MQKRKDRMEFRLGENERIVWKCETDGTTWSVWPVVDDGNPATDDELTDRTLEYRRSIGISRVTAKTNRYDVTRDSEEKIDVWLRARGIPLTFAAIRDRGNR